MRPTGPRLFNVALLTALAASLGKPGTLISCGSPSAVISMNRTAFSETANT
jgi:hypothetical protein